MPVYHAEVAELLGGTISVENEVGKDSTFTVRVPVEYQGTHILIPTIGS